MKRITFILGVAAAALALPAQANAEKATMKIHLKTGGKVLTATLPDTPTSRDFLSLLPLKLRLKDYARTEKISDLPRRLSIKDAPAGHTPVIGDLAYYAPWGNLAIFYQGASHAPGLIKLGQLDGGIEHLAAMNGEFEVELLRADAKQPIK